MLRQFRKPSEDSVCGVILNGLQAVKDLARIARNGGPLNGQNNLRLVNIRA